jgi:GT2 family glycosyltransferase
MNTSTILRPTSLSVSSVYYDTEITIFEKTIESIFASLEYAIRNKSLKYYELYLINNNPKNELLFRQSIKKYLTASKRIIVISNHDNIGYGRANNMAIAQTTCEYHLILNPDVITSIESIHLGIKYLESQPSVGILTPSAINATGNIEYLAKRSPTFSIIVLRGLNNKYLNKLFESSLGKYAYKDKIPTDTPLDVELASGCFMLCNTKTLKKVDGFSKDYFLYFEDFDLSRKISKISKVQFHPAIKIKHLGGNAARKGVKHILMFLMSAFKFKFSR